jgi:hypothetical protein
MIKEQFMTLAEFAKMHNMSQTNALYHCRRGTVDGAEKLGNMWVVPRESAEKFKLLGATGTSESMKTIWRERKAKHMPSLDELDAVIREVKKSK